MNETVIQCRETFVVVFFLLLNISLYYCYLVLYYGRSRGG